ncbi:hypothetical protein PVAP13_2KG024332 [Panicum virgatum]|uniref:Uncharacterized protein n=1 Tax=Panicum virgatum TaxID=38727 RepID=A0A8T0W8Q6_PANVG|nr:hypothetical protein PVAP13_2KG024332 [Panicum virgatum]
MGEMVASALAQEGVSRLSSYISTKLDDRASRAHTVARLEMALSRLEFVLEWSRKQPITYVSLIRRWNKFRCAYHEGVYLLNKHKLPALEGHEETDSVGEFVADVESACPLRRDTFFPYPFVRQLLQGKYLSYNKVKGRQKHHFIVSPVILEGRGVEALLWYEYFDPERLDKSLCLGLVLRLSESTDIVGAAIDCLRSSASLLNLPAQDAVMGELTQVPNLQDITDSYASPWVFDFEDCYPCFSKCSRPDPLCCQRNGHELSHIFQEQTIFFNSSCYVTARDYNLPSASNEAGTNVITDPSYLQLQVIFHPHKSSYNNYVNEAMGESKIEEQPFGSIQQTVDMIRSRSIDYLIRQLEVIEYYWVSWCSRHGYANFTVRKPSMGTAGVPKASGRYNTRSAAAKRKR